MARILWWLIGLPLGVAIVALSVANRKPIALALDPFVSDPLSPGLAFLPPIVLPGFVIVLGALIVGVVIGGVTVWIGQGRYRRDVRRWREHAQRLDGQKSSGEARDVTVPARLAPPGRRAA